MKSHNLLRNVIMGRSCTTEEDWPGIFDEKGCRCKKHLPSILLTHRHCDIAVSPPLAVLIRAKNGLFPSEMFLSQKAPERVNIQP